MTEFAACAPIVMALLGTLSLTEAARRGVSIGRLSVLVACIAVGWVAHFMAVGATLGLQRSGTATVPYLRMQQVVTGLALIALVFGGRRFLLSSAWRGANLRLPAVFVLVSFVVRCFYPPMLLHSEQYGVPILEDIFKFPDVATFRDSWGQVYFVVIGFICKVFNDVEAVFVANALASSLTVGIWVILVRRWSGSLMASVAVGLILGLHPGLVRVAASEDAHNVTLLFFSAGLLAVDVYAIAPQKGRALSAALWWLVLAVWSRQVAIILLPVAAILLLERGGWARFRTLDVLGAGVALFLVALTHLLFVARSDANSFNAIAAFLPLAISQLLEEPHPLIDPLVVAPPVALFLLVGVIGLAARRSCRWAMWTALVVTCVSSSLFCFGGPGMRLLFRAPLLLFSSAVAAIGVDYGWRVLQGRSSRVAILVFGAALALWVAFTARGLSHWAATDPVSQEFAFLREVVGQVPEGATIVTPLLQDFPTDFSDEEPRPGWAFPSFLVRDRNVRVLSLAQWRETPVREGCALFYRSVLCATLGSGEASPAFRDAWRKFRLGDATEGIVAVFKALLELDRHEPFVDDATLLAARAPCFESAEAKGSLHLGWAAEVLVPWRPYFANVTYPRDRMTVGFFDVPGTPPCP